MEFRILGPLEISDGGRRVDVGGPRSRALLGLLLLHANEVVWIDRLIDELWPTEMPSNAVKAVQVHVSRLRKALDAQDGSEESRIVTAARGYSIRVASDELDALRFRRLLEEGRTLQAGNAERARETLRQALVLWRGPPLADVHFDGRASDELDALEELRLVALEERIDADLAAGRDGELVSELRGLVREHPLREPFRGQLMLALYRGGRQSEALAAYRETRRFLVDEIGIEPSTDLQRLQQAILRQDVELERPPASAVAGVPHRSRLLAIAVGTVLAIVATAAWLVDRREGLSVARSSVAIAPNSVAVIDPESNRVVADIDVGDSPGPIAVGAGAVWIANEGDKTVSRIDPATREVTATIGLGFEATGLAVDGQRVWVAGGLDGVLAAIDTVDNVIRTRLTITPVLGPLPGDYGRGPSGVAVGAGAVWLAHGEEVSRIDPETGRVVATIAAGGNWTGAIAFGEGAVWVVESDVKKTRARREDAVSGVSRVEIASNVLSVTLPVVALPRDIAVGEGFVWAVVSGNDTLWQIDPLANRIARTFTAGTDPWGIAIGAQSVWIENDNDGTVTRVDARSGETIATIELGAILEDIAAGEGAVWVAVRG